MDKNRLKGKILLVAGGRKPPYDFLKDIIEEYNITYIIGVDKGCKYLMEEGINIDSAIGDFDSISGEYLNKIPSEKRINFPAEKDKSDLHLAIEFIQEYQPELVVITGATGERSDHALCNIFLLKILLDKNIESLIIDEYNRIELINKKKVLNGIIGTTLSVLPYTDKTEGVSFKGFKYPLDNADIYSGDSLTISNIIVEENAEITIRKGLLIIFIIREK